MRYAFNASGVSRDNCSTARGAALRISSPPTFGAMVVPSELNAWVRFRRLDAVSGLPKRPTYGFAATCRPVIPAARMTSAVRNNAYDATDAAGKNRNAPPAIVINPTTIVLWYPTLFTKIAHGMENRK